jgi:hypothetical protein
MPLEWYQREFESMTGAVQDEDESAFGSTRSRWALEARTLTQRWRGRCSRSDRATESGLKSLSGKRQSGEENGEKSREKRTKEGGSIVHLLRLDPKTINGRLD